MADGTTKVNEALHEAATAIHQLSGALMTKKTDVAVNRLKLARDALAAAQQITADAIGLFLE